MCTQVLLEQQVGSRYFVSASNASKIFFLAKASVEFLEYTDKDSGNNLERTVYKKLQDPEELSRLKADALMFYFVYADLVMLAKSNDLGKSALDMNQHYLELQLFLMMVEEAPQTTMYKLYKVFPSEARLYSSESSVNHSLHSKKYTSLCTPVSTGQLGLYSALPTPHSWSNKNEAEAD